jgi:hypothetical protein
MNYERWSLRYEQNKPRVLFTDLLATFFFKKKFCSSHRPGQFQRGQLLSPTYWQFQVTARVSSTCGHASSYSHTTLSAAQGLSQLLVSVRASIAVANDLAPYMVLPQAALQHLVESRPTTLDNMVCTLHAPAAW